MKNLWRVWHEAPVNGETPRGGWEARSVAGPRKHNRRLGAGGGVGSACHPAVF